MTAASAHLSSTANPVAPRPSLRRNVLRTSLGYGIYALAQWATIAVLAKLGTAELVGQYAFAVALNTPVLMLAQMNLRTVLATDVTGTHSFRDYLSLRLWTLAIGMAAIGILAVSGGGGAARIAVVVLVGLIQTTEWISDLYVGRMQLHERMDFAAISLALRGVSGLLALAIVQQATGSLTKALTAMLVLRTAVLVLFDAGFTSRKLAGFGSSNTTARKSGWTSQWSILRQALPLGAVLMLGALVINTPRYFIEGHWGTAALGVFSAIFSLATASNLFVNSLGQSATPRLARYFADNDAAGFERLSLQMAAGGVALGLVGIPISLIFGSTILRLVYKPEYAQHAALLSAAMLAAGIGFAASLLGYSITAARKFQQQVPLQLACLVGAAMAAYILVPAWGLAGAVAAVGTGSTIQVIAEFAVLRRALREMRRAGVTGGRV